MAPPKAFRRYILDYDGERLLAEAAELVQRATELLDVIRRDHLVRSWEIEREEKEECEE